MNVAIVTARAGSKSIRDKNVFRLENGDQLIAFPIRAALDATTIDRIYVSTDGDAIAAASKDMGCEIIIRPDELGGDTVNHGDVIRHAVEEVDAAVDDLRIVVLLLGNTVMVDGDLIDTCVRVLEEDPTLDSSMTVWHAADDHPYRAMEIRGGLLESWSGRPQEISTERQSYPDIYYYDQGVWAFRKECVKSKGPLSPWWWMGTRCRPVLRTWTTGRDVHTHFDILFAESYLARLAEFREREDRQVVRPPGVG